MRIIKPADFNIPVRTVHSIDTTEYRLCALQCESVYHSPLDEAAHAAMNRCYAELAPDVPVRTGTIRVLERDVPVRAMAHGCAWFEFDVLCRGMRSVSDYLELAKISHTLLLSKVPILRDGGNDAALCFMHLVDTLYERNVNLYIKAYAQAQPDRYIRGNGLVNAFSARAVGSRKCSPAIIWRARICREETRRYGARSWDPASNSSMKCVTASRVRPETLMPLAWPVPVAQRG